MISEQVFAGPLGAYHKSSPNPFPSVNISLVRLLPARSTALGATILCDLLAVWCCVLLSASGTVQPPLDVARLGLDRSVGAACGHKSPS